MSFLFFLVVGFLLGGHQGAFLGLILWVVIATLIGLAEGICEFIEDIKTDRDPK